MTTTILPLLYTSTTATTTTTTTTAIAYLHDGGGPLYIHRLQVSRSEGQLQVHAVVRVVL